VTTACKSSTVGSSSRTGLGNSRVTRQVETPMGFAISRSAHSATGFPLVQAAGYLENENALPPTVFERGAQIAFTGGTVLDPVENTDSVAPGQLCNELLHN
jgi:hypothetical protein